MPDKEIGSIELFISHASEDKADLVRPLADYLQRAGITVWYDEFSLTAGDSLSRSIDDGLTRARYGLVVISPHFIEKRWPEYELRGLTAKEISSENKVVIPLWHNVSREDLLKFSPPLADKVAVVSTGLKLHEIAERVVRAIRPDLARKMSILRALLRRETNGEIITATPDQIALMPLPKEFVTEGHVAIRVLNIVNTLGQSSPRLVGDFETFLTDLHRDIHPEIELRVWEVMTAAYLEVIRHFDLSTDDRSKLVELLLACSLDNSSWVDECCTQLRSDVAYHAIDRWSYYSKISSQEEVGFTTKK